MERRRPRAVVEVREARRGEGQAEREEGEPRGEAARAAARAPAAAVVLLLAVPRRLPRAGRGRQVLVVEVLRASGGLSESTCGGGGGAGLVAPLAGAGAGLVAPLAEEGREGGGGSGTHLSLRGKK